MKLKEKVVTRNGCPICNSHVKGNSKLKFFCKKCFLLFKEEELDSLFKK